MSRLNIILRKVTNFNDLRQLHAHLIRNSLHTQNYWVAQLVSLCTRLHAPPPYTRRVFEASNQPDAFVFSNMIMYYAHLGENSDVCLLFNEMQKCNVKPNASVYPLLIKSAGRDGVFFRAHLVKMGLDCDKYIRNAMMVVYGKYGPVEIGRELFDEMTERGIVDWNSMISGYWNWGNEVEARKLFDLMPEKNVITWTAMVSGYARMKDLENARRYFDEMPEKSVVSWNAILSGYAQNGLFEEGMRLFNELMNAGIRLNETTWVGVISLCSLHGDPKLAESIVEMINENGVRLNCFIKSALIDMYAKCGNLDMARKIFDELAVRRNPVSWNAMISGYAKVGDLDAARDLFDRMPQKDVVSWNSMIAGYAQNGQSAMAIDLFNVMTADKGLKPDEVTMVTVISACGHLGALGLAKQVVSYLTENQIKLNPSGYNSLIFMYSKCGSMKDAENIFHEMESRDVISYNTLITGFAAYGNGRQAVKLLRKMKEEGIEPDRITYIGVLTACSHAGLQGEGQKVFELIKEPDIDHYACMVDLLGRVGKLDDARALIDGMPMAPHAGVFGSLLNAGRVHKRIDLGEYAANKLFELEPENSGNYVLLSNIYAMAGRWKDVERVRGMMRKGRVKKTTGWSLFEHGRKMHKFIVGDRSHERAVDIYKKLAELKEKMLDAGYAADKSCVLRDVEEEEKDEMIETHSEKMAISFALLVSEPGSTIRIVKNLRVCWDCHEAIKIISMLEGREIIVRDNNRFHCFNGGRCSCKDYW